MTGYKAARITDNPEEFGPATSYALQSIRYRLGETTIFTESGPGAVFNTLEQANSFIGSDPSVVLEVEYEPSNEEMLWKYDKYGIYHSLYWQFCPAGTRLARSITPRSIVSGDGTLPTLPSSNI